MSFQPKITDLKSEIKSLRDFYAFEQHVKTCRAHRGLEMVPQWYQVPVFYFSSPVAILRNDEPVWAPHGSSALDYELELACVIGTAARDLPADDSAMECVAGFTIMNDWSARDIQRAEMAVGLGPSKSKDFATSLGPSIVPFSELSEKYKDGHIHLDMTASVNGKQYSHGNSGTKCTCWTWPQILAHASRDTELGCRRRHRFGDCRHRLYSGTDARGCRSGWLKPPAMWWNSPSKRLGTLRNVVVERPQ